MDVNGQKEVGMKQEIKTYHSYDVQTFTSIVGTKEVASKHLTSTKHAHMSFKLFIKNNACKLNLKSFKR